MRVAIGPATSPPCPEAPCTITTTTYFGWSNGAKHVTHAPFSSWPRSVACAVPVFPATTTSFKRALPPVPPSSLTTSKGLCAQGQFCQVRFPDVSLIALVASEALRRCHARPARESRLGSKLDPPAVGNSRRRRLLSSRRPSSIAEAK